jgi:hypothetical protein
MNEAAFGVLTSFGAHRRSWRFDSPTALPNNLLLRDDSPLRPALRPRERLTQESCDLLAPFSESVSFLAFAIGQSAFPSHAELCRRTPPARLAIVA